MTGGTGNDTLSLGAGDDVFLVGKGEGFDRFDGGFGNDTIRATAKSAVIGIESISGVENISSGGFSGVRIEGTISDNLLNFLNTMLSGIDSINGGAGNDTIIGSIGADRIIGASGRDNLTGSGGADAFVYQALSDSTVGANADHILDFVSGLDKFDFSAFDANLSMGGKQNFTFIGTGNFTGLGQLRLGMDGGQVALFGNVSGNLNPDFEIILDNNPATILATDFII